MPLTLQVFPNTGHHFFTRRLAELLPTQKNDGLVRLVKQGTEQFVPWSEEYPWLRYRLGLVTDAAHANTPVITIAVESNLGHETRATLYRSDPCAQGLEPENVFPYAREFLVKPNQDYTDKIRGFAVGDASYEVDLEIKFMGRSGNPVDVDLIVDLGNTRTAAVLLEAPPADKQTPLTNRLRALTVCPRGTELGCVQGAPGLPQSMSWAGDHHDLAIIDSWFLLHETLFAHLEPGSSEAESKFSIRRVSEREVRPGEPAWFLDYYLPHSFIELSPALIGGGKSHEGAAYLFSVARLERDYPFYLSSPKRYVWSQSRRGVVRGMPFWFQLHRDAAGVMDFVGLRGLIRYFMATDGHDLHTDVETLQIDQPVLERFAHFVHDAPPTYSNSDAVCWFALALIEAAYRQMNSEGYLERVDNNVLRRRLRYVRVTCPAGWTFEERDLYFRQWQRAINLFTMSRFSTWEPAPTAVPNALDEENEPSRPTLCFENLDEAICSQLPILYAEIKSFANQADKWIELYGRDNRVVVMNLDIGGGTTDLAIIRYTNTARNETRLRPQLLVRDGFSIAGDMVVKRIIERVLIPAWFEASLPGQNPGLAQARGDLETLFRQPRNARIANVGGRAATAPKRLARIVRLLFIPLANLLLKGLCDAAPAETLDPLRRARGAAGVRTLNIAECREAEIIGGEMLAELNHLCAEVIRQYYPQAEWNLDDKVFSDAAILKCNLQTIEQCIDEVFEPLFNGLAGLVAKHQCDLLIVSGKPSELSRVAELIRRAFPLLPQRIIRVKDYPAGNWYPSEFATVEEGRITDAKTCTVVGAALYQDISYNQPAGFSVVVSQAEEFQRGAYWGIIPKQGAASGFFDRLLFRPADYPPAPPASDEQTAFIEATMRNPIRLNLASDHRVGRQLVNDKSLQAAPVYRLYWKRREAGGGVVQVADADVKFRWRSYRGQGDKLEIAEVKAAPGMPSIALEDLCLELNTLMPESDDHEGEFWLDDPHLAVTFAGPAVKPGTQR